MDELAGRSPGRRRFAPWVIVQLAAALAGGCGRGELDARAAPDPAWPDDAYLADHQAWRAQRLAGLTGEDGWLSLVGLHWLEPGTSRFGTGAENDIVLPQAASLTGLPETLGQLRITDGRVRLEVAPGVAIAVDGVASTAADLTPTAPDEAPVVTLGSLAFFVIARGEHMALRVRDRASPARSQLGEIETFPLARRWLVEGRFEAYAEPRSIAVPNITPFDYPEVSPGVVIVELAGLQYRLLAVAQNAAERLFLIVGDQTNGKSTYGGGRYLYTDPPDSEGRVVVDFNRLYNPPCVFTPYATCPLPPEQNRLPLTIEAGEMTHEKKKHASG